MYFDDEVGARLVHARTLVGKSQVEIAAAAGLAATQLSRYESGRSTPRPATLKKIAEALNVSPTWLASGSGALNEHEFKEPLAPGQREVTFQVPPEVVQALHRHADEAGITINEQIRRIIMAFADEAVGANKRADVDEIAERVAERLNVPFPPKAGSAKKKS